jgi:hypothetical protein
MYANSRFSITGAGSGIYVSIDSARTWQRAEAGLPPGAPGIAFVANDALILAAVIEEESTPTMNNR